VNVTARTGLGVVTFRGLGTSKGVQQELLRYLSGCRVEKQMTEEERRTRKTGLLLNHIAVKY